MDLMNFTIGYALSQRYKGVSRGDRVRAAAAAGLIPPPAVGIITAKTVLDRAEPVPAPPKVMPPVGKDEQDRKIAGLQSSLTDQGRQITAHGQQISELTAIVKRIEKKLGGDGGPGPVKASS